jgi:thiosulfate/3-mercaptopyruvate sulfurtransferase
MIPPQNEFQQLIQAAGVDADKPIVLVPMGTEVADVDEALRVYWQFKVYGEDQIAVLDGGMAKWLLEGRSASQEGPAARTGNWSAKADRSQQYVADSEEVAKAQANHSATLVDGRDARLYAGLEKRDYVFAFGHLEGARLYPMDLMYKNQGGALTFMPASTYKGLMTAQGVNNADATIAYCNSGHLASGPWFLMSEVLGNSKAKLYGGSLHEWTLEKRPVQASIAQP